MGTLFGFEFLKITGSFWPPLQRSEAASGGGCVHNSKVVVTAGEGGVRGRIDRRLH